MWCHLCKLNFIDTEIFKCHILEKHRPESGFYKDSDCEESEPEEDDISEHSNSSVEIHNEDPTVSFQDGAVLSIDSSPNESVSKNISETATSNSSQNQSALRRSSRLKKPTYKLKISSSSEDSDIEEEDQITKNSVPSVSNQLYVINPLGNQVLGQQPLYVINSLNSNTSQVNENGPFVLNSKNILEWLNKHKELCKNLKYPLTPQLFKKVKLVHKQLISHYYMASPNEENNIILQVYEDLNNMILKHIESIHAEL